MYTNSELHDRIPECIAYSQLCVLEDTKRICISCRRVRRQIRIRNEPPSLGETPLTVLDDPYGPDDELAAGDPTQMAIQDGIPRDFLALRTSGVGQLEYSRNKDDCMGSPSRIDAEQGSGESGVKSCGAKQNDQGRDQVIGGSDENSNPMDVEENDEKVPQLQANVALWVSGVTNTCVGKRSGDIEQALRQVNLAFRSEAPLSTPAAGDYIELSDDTEKNE
ncbi:hypothetical protein ACHAPO_010953 [Fusarium lateritium]